MAHHDNWRDTLTNSAHEYANSYDLCDRFDDFMEQHGLPRRDVTLRITLTITVPHHDSEIRHLERCRDGSGLALHGEDTPAEGGHRARLQADIDDLSDQLAHNQTKLSDAGGIAHSKATVSAGDLVRIRGTWYPVVRANTKTVSVPNACLPATSKSTDTPEADQIPLGISHEPRRPAQVPPTRADGYASKFLADTALLEPPAPLEPTNENLAAVLSHGGLSRPATPEEYPAIRAAVLTRAADHPRTLQANANEGQASEEDSQEGTQ